MIKRIPGFNEMHNLHNEGGAKEKQGDQSLLAKKRCIVMGHDSSHVS